MCLIRLMCSMIVFDGFDVFDLFDVFDNTFDGLDVV